MRYLLTLALATGLLLSFGATALAEETEPEPCVPGVEVTTYTHDRTNNIIQVTATTTCTEVDGEIVEETTYAHETVAYYFWSPRTGGFYVAAEDLCNPASTSCWSFSRYR